MSDTIFALSTLIGKSGVAVFRISGPQALPLAVRIALNKNRESRTQFEHSRAYLSKIVNPKTEEQLDEALVIFFKGPNSFTGEDTLEIQTHGSLAIIKDILALLSELGLRPAEPGEFSKRSFLNGKMDLTRAEGLADLIEAETSLQRRVALEQLNGANETVYENWRQQLIEILAYLEALIDYPDDDLPASVLEKTEQKVIRLATEISKHLYNSTGEIIKEGVKIAISGEPNVGKSTLINALAKRDVAIVSSLPGTTRDVIEVKLDIKGYPVIFCDTAGIRESEDEIELIGIKRALKMKEQANLVLLISDQLEVLQRHPDMANVIKVLNKDDQGEINQEGIISISAREELNISRLLTEIENFIVLNYTIDHSALLTNSRYKHHFSIALQHLKQFNIKLPIELQAEEVRVAASEIGRIVGKIDLEEILDQLFGSFCIGK